MPNTLAHFGGQGVLTRLGFPRVDVRWILLGCVIPDLPWIGQRLLRVLGWGVLDPMDFRLYAIGQASLLVSLLLCGAFAAVSRRPPLVFAVLGAGSLLHLVMDALQTKWGNGVHFLVPFHWEQTNVGWFWPESVVTYGLTAAGIAYLAVEWFRRDRMRPVLASDGLVARGATAMTLVSGYLLVPLILIGPLERADAHSVGTLRNVSERPGRAIAFDRERAVPGDEHPAIYTFAGEELRLRGAEIPEPSTVSVEGTFEDPKTVRVHRLHRHASRWRELSSIIGLSLLLLAWGWPLVPRSRASPGDGRPPP